jgi:UbiD family decarboxylase
VCELLHQTDRAGPALLFEHIKGHTTKVVGNLVGSKKRLALAFTIRHKDKLLETYRKRRGVVASRVGS